jgi:hypothetical protein
LAKAEFLSAHSRPQTAHQSAEDPLALLLRRLGAV